MQQPIPCGSFLASLLPCFLASLQHSLESSSSRGIVARPVNHQTVGQTPFEGNIPRFRNTMLH